MQPINHLALLVPSVKKAAANLEKFGFVIGPPEEWEGEGTLEIYVGDKNLSGLLLLMEPLREGAYSRAMRKRGPGLHHIAIDVLNIENFIIALSGSGWLLHPKSLMTIRDSRTAYLARPGTPMLIEVQERDALEQKPSFISEIMIPLSAQNEKLVQALGLYQVLPSESDESFLKFGALSIPFKDLGIP